MSIMSIVTTVGLVFTLFLGAASVATAQSGFTTSSNPLSATAPNSPLNPASPWFAGQERGVDQSRFSGEGTVLYRIPRFQERIVDPLQMRVGRSRLPFSINGNGRNLKDHFESLWDKPQYAVAFEVLVVAADSRGVVFLYMEKSRLKP